MDCANGRVTVVLPTYNRADLLPRAIQSVWDQTAADRCDVVVVDDGGTDDTAEVIAGSGGNVRYIREPHAGVAAARNAGIGTLDNEFIAFLDSDDVWAADKVERQLTAMERWPKVVLVAGHTLARDADGTTRPHVVPALPHDEPFDLAPHLFESCIIETPAIMIRSRCLAQTGLFETSLVRASDYHLWLRLACCGPCVYLGDPPLATFAVGAPLSLSVNLAARARGVFRALGLSRHLLRRRPDCRAAWKRKRQACLVDLRDLARRERRHADVARYAAASLLHQPWGRPRWEWGLCVTACAKAIFTRPSMKGTP